MEQLPILSKEGWVANKNVILAKLFEYFLASDYSQSNTFSKTISSLKYILSNYQDSVAIKTSIVQTLSIMYAGYFDSVDVTVDLSENSETSTINLVIDITAVANGTTYYLSREIKNTKADITSYEKALDDYYTKNKRE